jgi:hypothetical protein
MNNHTHPHVQVGFAAPAFQHMVFISVCMGVGPFFSNFVVVHFSGGKTETVCYSSY